MLFGNGQRTNAPINGSLCTECLLDCLNGEKEASYTLYRDDGMMFPISAAQFFHENWEFPEIDRKALYLCYGKVLVLGVGAGFHSLYLQEKGLDVTVIDISLKAVEVMKRRGVRKIKVGGSLKMRINKKGLVC